MADESRKPIRRTVHRPSVAVPSFALLGDNLGPVDSRWPLTRDPSPEPHAPLAVIYRASGSWTELCDARGEPRKSFRVESLGKIGIEVVDRDAALTYLLAWCDGRQSNSEAMRQSLVSAAEPQNAWYLTNAFAKAARADIVDMLALDSMPASSALSWLQLHQLAVLPVLETLTAAYLAVGRENDATTVVTLIARTAWMAYSSDCRTMYRAWMLLGEPWIRAQIKDRSAHHPTCSRISRVLDDRDVHFARCPLQSGRWDREGCSTLGCARADADLAKCDATVATSPRALFAAAFAYWPAGETDASVWMAYARYAIRTRESGAEELAFAALENAALFVDCRDYRRIVELARALSATSAALAPRLTRFLAWTPATCSTRHSPNAR